MFIVCIGYLFKYFICCNVKWLCRDFKKMIKVFIYFFIVFNKIYMFNFFNLIVVVVNLLFKFIYLFCIFNN